MVEIEALTIDGLRLSDGQRLRDMSMFVKIWSQDWHWLCCVSGLGKKLANGRHQSVKKVDSDIATFKAVSIESFQFPSIETLTMRPPILPKELACCVANGKPDMQI